MSYVRTSHQSINQRARTRAPIVESFVAFKNGQQVNLQPAKQGRVIVLDKIVIDGWIENLHTSQEFRSSFPNSRFSTPGRNPHLQTNELLDFTNGANVPIDANQIVGFDSRIAEPVQAESVFFNQDFLNLACQLKTMNADPELNEESDEFQDIIKQIDSIGASYDKNLLNAQIINAAADLFNLTQAPGFNPNHEQFTKAVNVADALLDETALPDGGQDITLDNPQFLEVAQLFLKLKDDEADDQALKDVLDIIDNLQLRSKHNLSDPSVLEAAAAFKNILDDPSFGEDSVEFTEALTALRALEAGETEEKKDKKSKKDKKKKDGKKKDSKKDDKKKGKKKEKKDDKKAKKDKKEGKKDAKKADKKEKKKSDKKDKKKKDEGKEKKAKKDKKKSDKKKKEKKK